MQEVPCERAICISAYGCPLKCKGCSWKDENKSREFTLDDLNKILNKYKNGLASCICFLGGEWNPDFIHYVKLCKKEGYKTCLYTGLDTYNDPEIIKHLDYLKTGHWDELKGGLDSKETNQKFMNVKTNESMNKYFWR